MPCLDVKKMDAQKHMRHHRVLIKKMNIWVQWCQWFLLSVVALFQQKCRRGFLDTLVVLVVGFSCATVAML